MRDRLVALKVLIVSDAASERAALEEAAAKALVAVETVDLGISSGVSAICDRLRDSPIDVVFLDSRMSYEDRQAVIEAAPDTNAKPLVVSLGLADSKSGAAASEPLAVDAVLAKPVVSAKAAALFNACARARLPSRTLIVDDSSTMRAVIRKVLQSSRFRFEIEEAANGEAALEMVGQRRFDIMILDYNMPGLNGFATLNQLMQSHADTKVIMVTATNDAKLAYRARAIGAHTILYKPFYAKDIDDVMGVLHGLKQFAH